MSLIDYAGAGILPGMFTACTKLERVTDDGSDGQFGYDARYVDGAGFDAMLIKVKDAATQVAERKGLKRQYTVVVKRGISLRQNDVFRRESDGMVFIVTGTTTDGEAPDPSTIQIAKTTAEEWVMPT